VNQNTQLWISIITAGVQVITLIVIVVYTVYTAKMASSARTSAEAANNTIKEMKRAREQENAPYIVVYFDIPKNKHLIYLVIKNVGKSIATDVKLTFTPPLSSYVFKGINDAPLIKDGLLSLPPNYELRTLFDGIIQRFGDKSFPMTYTAEISYADGIVKERRSSIQTIDLSMFYGLMKVNEKDQDDLVKAVEEIAKRTHDINDNMEEISENLARGVWIKNSMLMTSQINRPLEIWFDSLLAKLQEFVLLWQNIYGKSDENQVDPFITDLRNKLILISEQLMVFLTESPDSISNEIKEAIRSISANLQTIGYKRFYLDGGASLRAFDALGDDTVQQIDLLTKQILQEKGGIAVNSEQEVFD